MKYYLAIELALKIHQIWYTKSSIYELYLYQISRKNSRGKIVNKTTEVCEIFKANLPTQASLSFSNTLYHEISPIWFICETSVLETFDKYLTNNGHQEFRNKTSHIKLNLSASMKEGIFPDFQLYHIFKIRP